jgi:hypothetical protein
MKTKTVLFLLPVIICCLAGCAESATEPPEEIPAIPDNTFEKVINFTDLSIEEAQEIMQGRWEVVRYCHDWGCDDTAGYRYHEFMGTDTIRRVNIKTPDDSIVVFLPIHSWEKMEYGIQINLENFGVYFLHYMFNDTLRCSDPSIIISEWYMKKTD